MFHRQIWPAGSGRRQPWLPAEVGAAATLCALVLLAAGCGRKPGADPVVMTVGTRSVPLEEFQEAFWTTLKSDTTLRADTTSLRKFVPIYADRVLMETLAQEADPVLEGTPRDRLDQYREQAIVEALHKAAYGDAYKINPAALKRAYELQGRRLHLRYMLLKDREDADNAIRALREGAVFAKIAQQRSQDARSAASGGDLGWIVYTDLDAAIRDKVFSLKPGELGGPYPWGDNFQVFKVEEEGTNEARGTLEQERAKLEGGLRSTRVRAAREKFLDDLLRKYHFKVDPAELAWMTVLLREKTASITRMESEKPDDESLELDGSLRTTNPWTTPPVALADTGRVLATYDAPDGAIKPLTVLDQLLEEPAVGWPTFENTRDLEKLIRDLVLERLEIIEATARGFDKTPEMAKALALKEKEIRSRFFFRTHVRPKAKPPEGQVRAYYEAHRGEFQDAELRRFVGVSTANWDHALLAARELKAGRPVDEVARELAASDTSVRTTGPAGTKPLSNGQSPLLDRFLFHLPLNGVSDPIPVGRAFTVAKVIEIVPPKDKTLKEVEGTIHGRLLGARVDSALKETLAEGRQRFPVKINWDVVWRASLQPPQQGS